LCTDCDTKVHAANKLANKHQRVPLMAPTDAPRCDICQVCFLHGFLRNPLLVSCFRVVGSKTRSRVASSSEVSLATANTACAERGAA
jgi:hypothetical protein